MNILMTADTVGGVWTYALELVKGLQTHGVEVHLATMGAKLNKAQKATTEEITNLTIHESSYKLEWMDNPWEDVLAAGEWLIELKNQIQPDLVHLNNFTHGTLDWQLPVLMVIHSDVLTWWHAVLKDEAPAEWTAYRRLVTKGLQAANLVVAPTKHMLAAAEMYYGPFKRKTHIYNGLAAKDFTPAEKKEQIFSMGRVWDEAKNMLTLCNAAQDVSWPIYIAGDNQHPSEDKVIELENCDFLGNLDKAAVREWLSESAIYALPARYEPFGLSALEAALSGCTLVLGKIPTLEEVWGDAAIFKNPENKDEHAAAIEHLIKDKIYRKRMAEKAYQRALSYSREQMTERYLNSYQVLIKSFKSNPQLNTCTA